MPCRYIGRIRGGRVEVLRCEQVEVSNVWLVFICEQKSNLRDRLLNFGIIRFVKFAKMQRKIGSHFYEYSTLFYVSNDYGSKAKGMVVREYSFRGDLRISE